MWPFLFLVFLFSSLEGLAANCVTPPPNKKFLALKSALNRDLYQFSNSKAVAGKADATLSKLIEAKSPVIRQWIKRRGANRTEDQIARAWRLYYAKNFTLTKYPSGDPLVDRKITFLVNQTLERLKSLEIRKYLNNSFERAKSLSLQVVSSLRPDSQAAIKKRIRSMKLYWPNRLQDARNKSIPMDIIGWGVAYDPVPNQINIGIEALRYANDEMLLAVFAHEIGHSFDSCRWGAFFKKEWPFINVGRCLRSSKSVGAKKRDDSQINLMIEKGRLSRILVQALKENPTCNKMQYPVDGIQADQLPEAFADWFSAEVMARFYSSVALAGRSMPNFRADLCKAQNLRSGSSYPSNQARLERIYWAHPRLGRLAQTSVSSSLNPRIKPQFKMKGANSAASYCRYIKPKKSN